MSNLSLLTSTDPTAATHPAWPAFQRAAAGTHYDKRALGHAWTWFRNGWDAKIAQLKAEATDEWCDAW